MIRLSLRALSVYGEQITNALKASEFELNRHCSCPPGESCSVEITELPGRRFEAVVTRPRRVTEPHEWAAHISVAGMYRRLFDKRTNVTRIREAVADIIGAVLEENEPTAKLSAAATDDPQTVVVDTATIKRARQLISGCQMCSPYAEIPFDSILDRVTGHDPAVTQYFLIDGSAKCPRCARDLHASTLVDFKPPRGE
jgi:hypothetical protein